MRPICSARVALVFLFVGVSLPPTRPQGVSPDATSQAIMQATYPDSPEGLKHLLQDLFVSVKAGDIQKTSQVLASFEIPNHREWFLKTFGEIEGARLDAKYVELRTPSADWLKKRIETAVKDAKTEVLVSVYQQPEDKPMVLIQSVLRAMVRPVPIYNASDRRDANDRSPFNLGEFVYFDGGFRYLERQVLQALSTAPPMRLWVGGNVQRAKLIKKVEPVYPILARENHIQGTVPLHVILARDGTVAQVEVLGGDPALQMAAVDAVRQCRYQPTLLNGMPVEVDTLIDVVFSLR